MLSIIVFMIGMFGDEGGVQSLGTFPSKKIADVRVGLDEGALCSIILTRRRFTGSSSCIAVGSRARFAYVRLIMFATYGYVVVEKVTELKDETREQNATGRGVREEPL